MAVAVQLAEQVPQRQGACGSSPAVGSSRNSTDGRWKIARATISRCAIPPDSAYTDALAHLASWNCSSGLVRDLPGLLGPHPEQPPVKGHVLPHRELAVEGVLLRNDAAQLFGQRRMRCHVDPPRYALPDVGTTRVVSIPAVVVFFRAIGPQQPEDHEGLDVEVELVDRGEVRPRVDLGQVLGVDDRAPLAVGQPGGARRR